MNLERALRLGRGSNLPTVWSNVLAASVLAGGDAAVTTLVAICGIASLLYTGGMFLNDAFDAEIDARQRPERPIPAGEISRASVFAWGFGLLLVGTVGAFAINLRAGLTGLATCAAIVLYDAWHKGNPVGPVVMGLCRFGVYALSGFAVTASPDPVLWWGGALLLGYVLGLTYVAKYETRGGIAGWIPLLGLVAPVVWVLFSWSSTPLLRSFLGGYGMWVQRAVSQIRTGKAPKIRAAVGGLIAGISLLDALFLAHAGTTNLAMVCVALFGLTMALQTRVAGT